ncbi:hypothetical protein ACNKHQ_07155 [Shigella flexneri]
MVDSLNQYEQHGLVLHSRELPDHLPLYLEYLAQSGQRASYWWFAGHRAIMALLCARLQQRESVARGAVLNTEAREQRGG